jgi:aminoglycoside/choline kinase family phosphotransferase
LYNKNESIIKETYFNILQSLSSLHYHPSSDKESLKIYDLDWKLREIGMTVEYYENNLRHNNYRADKIVAIFRNILKKVDHPLGICHRDLQTKNIYWKNNEIIFIDHQDSFRSPGIYDLASILEDPYFRVNDKIKNEVKSYSFKLFNQYQVGSKISIEQFLDDYAVYAVQRLYKAIGSYAKVFYDHRNPRYLEFISNAFANIRDLVTCHPVLSDLEFLVKDYYEL